MSAMSLWELVLLEGGGAFVTAITDFITRRSFSVFELVRNADPVTNPMPRARETQQEAEVLIACDILDNTSARNRREVDRRARCNLRARWG